jgi:hypothetical protein
VQYLGFVDGINDAASRRAPSQEYEVWKDDMFWMSGYFSAAVLASIFLSYAPGRVTEEMPSANPGAAAIAAGGPVVQGNV